MKKIISWAAEYWRKHRAFSVVGIIVVGVLGYYLYGVLFPAATETSYTTARAAKETVIASISGTGQVYASTEVALSARASGDVTQVYSAVGKEVPAGALIATLDARDAVKGVRDAEVNLESARIAYEKLARPSDALTITQAENTLLRARESKTDAEASILKAREDAFTDVSNAFVDLPSIMSGLSDLLFTITPSTGSNEQNIDFYGNAAANYDSKADTYRDEAYRAYQAARSAYDKNFITYKALTRASEQGAVLGALDETYTTTKLIADAEKSASDLILFYKDKLIERGLKPVALADTHLATLASYTAKTNGHLSTLLQVRTTITSAQAALVDAERTIGEKEATLADLRAGTDELDLRSSRLSLTQRENALLDAKETLANYSVRAPFAGTLAALTVKKGDRLQSGASVGTLIGKMKQATIGLNEVDVAKVAVGQKATLTFDAIDDLTITGVVSAVDELGTVAQGVVNYDVTIAFDVDDPRVKPGMSVSATIITAVRPDVLTVPASAVKTRGETKYVLIFDPPLSGEGETATAFVTNRAPVEKIVTVGLSDDTQTEIIDGLAAGDEVVTKSTVSGVSATASAPSIFGAAGIRTPGTGGGNRTIGR